MKETLGVSVGGNPRAKVLKYGYTSYFLMKSMAVVITRPEKSKSA